MLIMIEETAVAYPAKTKLGVCNQSLMRAKVTSMGLEK